MAFLAAVSSSIGKRLLLFGLRHIDILDKDPAEFVSVDVGKKTTLEVRDVGLHIKKLVALLHLKLPPEIHLSKAKASVLRVTFVLDFGVPQIIIEVDGIQVHATLAEDSAHYRGKETQGRRQPSASLRPRPSAPAPDESSSDISDDADDALPTVDDLAQSFLREEPDEEIRELEEQLHTQSEYLQESVSSSEDGDDESAAGMGAPLALPTYLRNMLNTALDRLRIVVNHIDIEVEDQFPPEPPSSSDNEDPFVSLHFHINQISIDSVTSPDAKIDISASIAPAKDPASKLGKRRMRIENICARLISDADNFASRSQSSSPSSPVDTRSEASSNQRSRSEPSSGRFSDQEASGINASENGSTSIHSSTSNIQEDDISPSPVMHSPGRTRLASSVLTTDEDRFADAGSEDGLDDSTSSDMLIQSQHALAADHMSASSILYDDEGLLDYAMHNDLLGNSLDESRTAQPSATHSVRWEVDRTGSSHELPFPPSGSEGSSILPSASALGRSGTFSDRELPNPPVTKPKQGTITPRTSQDPTEPTEVEESHSTSSGSQPSSPSPPVEEDMTESKLFTHDDAESMYMSAMSAAPPDASRHRHVPGGWDSSSTSSHDTGSDTSGPIPEAMVAGSILGPLPDADDGCETPRPGSRQSLSSSNRPRQLEMGAAKKDQAITLIAKPFLTIDEVIIWFPLGLGEDETQGHVTESKTEESSLDFQPPNIGEDSIFQEMPGSFSSYAHSTSSRRKGSVEEAARKRSPLDTPQAGRASTITADQEISPAVSIEIGSFVGHVDFSTGRIMLQLVDKLLKALMSGPETKEKVSTKEKTPKISQTSAELSIRHVGIAWIERLMTESVSDQVRSRAGLELNPVDALLKISLSSIRAASQVSTSKARAKLLIGKFNLSSLGSDIISFQSSKAKSKRPTSKLTEQPANDIEIDYEQATESRVTIVTRPVKVAFDMQKLDEGLSSFGGFSGILELGNSIASNHTIGSPVISPTRARPRGVHFGDVPPTPTATKSPGVPKIHVQFGEVTFVLKGKSCAVHLQTTSVRIAVRENNLRLKVSEVQLSGPYTDASQVGAPLMVELRNSTVNYLFQPEELDLARLISMITPSKDPYENDEDILIDTLLRQRRKGSVLRVEVGNVGIRLSDLDQMKTFEALGNEVARLSKVTKYLPDDDRPGILTLATIQRFELGLAVNERLGDISVALQDASFAHVGVPALFAAEIRNATVSRGDEILVHEVVKLRRQDQLPMIMVRMVGDEMEPVAKAKLFNVCAEYRVSTIMAALGISDDGTADDIALGLASSVATITVASSPKSLSRQSSQTSSPSTGGAKALQIDLLLRSCAIGLNPRHIPAKGLFVLTEAHFKGNQGKDKYSVAVELRKASIHAIDDIARLENTSELPTLSSISAAGNPHLLELHNLGFVSLSSISAAKLQLTVEGDGKDHPQIVDVEFKNELFVLESCADSTQTLIAILNGLQPPSPPSTGERYRTVVPLQQMMESFTGDAVEDDEFMEGADLVADDVPTNLEFVGSFYNPESIPTEEDMGDSMLGEDELDALAPPPVVRQRGDRSLSESFQEQYEVAEDEQDFNFDQGYLKHSDSEPKGKARKWDSSKNQYHLTNEFKVPGAPLKVRVRDVNIVWNLFDGYDWPRTRGIIAQAVEDVEARAEERRRKPRDEDEEEDFVEADYLFNSVWIGVPVKEERGALARQINRDIDDLASETGSYATSTATRSTGATIRPRSSTKSRKRLKLERGKHRKIAIQLSGVAVDLIVFPPDSGETLNSVDVRVRDFEIYDHVPSSTWRKFVTCMLEPSRRELNRPMINLELLTVKPITDLAASELVIRVTVLPLRLHVDQDALDFITRFFEFKDASALENSTPSDQPFIQRLEVNAVTLKLDYKPKRVDYGGIRSGHTTEFMNFLILDGADIVLRHAIVYGIISFDKLHTTLNDVWMPDVKRNQLPSVLSGLAAVRPLVNVGSGMRDLVVIPMREYKKDGRIVRSLQKGVYAFAKNTTSEVARLGAKVAIGTQTLLEGAETFLSPQAGSPGRPSSGHYDWDSDDPSSADAEEPRAVSNYANQPIGVRAGLRSAARHLERDLLTARDAIIAIPSEIMEEGTGVGMARAFARRAPTVILRPAVGATKAVSNALLGVGNALDADSRRKIDNKYKSY
ncbi:hypothetical protein BDV95DRAFT_121462 [Massariosphaeria phaeospora]|uniref:Autophagy-related protein 2 n=1 Tax=Massariosphaeria phaeospora TaxID=100035 RepID=A0A7C8I210_9PLEO|nr:hypothetical protein BDV95DRAFT_121462 [Massariosphaeria phaeospora]